MRRLEQGQTIKGISLKLQEEERERRCENASLSHLFPCVYFVSFLGSSFRSMDYVPSTSAIDTSRITVDPETKKMLEKLELTGIPVTVKANYRTQRRRQD